MCTHQRDWEKEEGVREKRGERKIGYFKGYLCELYLCLQDADLPKCLILLLKMPKCSQTAVYQWSHTVKSGIDLFSCTPLCTPHAGLQVPIPVLTCALENSSCVAYPSAISVPQVPDSRLEVGHRHSLGPRLQWNALSGSLLSRCRVVFS